MDTSELRRLAAELSLLAPWARGSVLEAADEIDQLRRECREEHELYLIRTEERDEARAEAQKYHDMLLMEQLKTSEDRELDIANGAADGMADKLRAIAETGVHRGMFGGENAEAAAQAILRIRTQLARAMEVLRYYSDELLYYEPDAPIDGGQSARDLLRDLNINSTPETLKPE